MLTSHEETQSEFSKVSMSDGQHFKKATNVKSHFASEPLSDIQNHSNYIQSSMKMVQRNANQTTKSKDNKPIMVNQNVILIKPKRSSEYGMPQKNDQNSVSGMKSSSKPKRTTHIKDEKNEQNETTSLNFKTMRHLLSQRNFILKPLERNDAVKCKITHFSSAFNNNLFISLKGQSKLLVTTQKIFTLIGNRILLKTPEENSSEDQTNKLSEKPLEPLIGIIQSNFDGSIFNVYEFSDLTKQKELIATIQYLGNKGIAEGPRRVKIFYKDQTIPTLITNMEAGQNFRDFIKRTGDNQSVQLFETRQPQYNAQNESYYLPFNSKVNVVPSVHNTIFVNKEQKTVLNLYKTFSKQYELNCYHPLSPFIGCAYVISSFCFKLISQ